MTAYSKKLIIFDLDGTLTKSKSPMDEEMAGLMSQLLERKQVAVISGGGYPQFQEQFLSRLPGSADNFNNLYIMPTSGTKLYVWRGSWVEKYSENLSPQEKTKVLSALNSALKAAGIEQPQTLYGQQIEDRGSQITFSALGQKAPYELKAAWDPNREKRQKVADLLKPKLPDYEVRVGGSTSVDITKRGINKGYGIRKLEQFLNIQPDDILFVGDALFYGGNDYPAKASGVDCQEVKGPEETKELIKSWVS